MNDRSVSADIDISCDLKLALQAFTEHKHLNGWWGVAKSLIQLEPGGGYSLSWQENDQSINYVTTGIVQAYREAEFLEIGQVLYFNPERPILGPMGFKITVSQRESGCNLAIVQSGYQRGEHWDWYYESVKNAWPNALKVLKEYLEALH